MCKNNDNVLRDQIHSYAQRVFSMGPGRPNQDSSAIIK